LLIDKSPGWIRAVQIGLGLVILALSIVVLINPILGTVSVIFFLALLLLFAGIEKAVSGFLVAGKSRFISIGLGVIVMGISLIAMTYPVGASIFVAFLLGIALLVEGTSRIIHGAKNKQSKGWSKSFGIGVGILSVIFGGVIMARPDIGLAFAGVLIGISLLVTSIQIISGGITGKPRKEDPLIK
jgi:uncharacterized membrane protein HdeD (DUF308 family)